MKGNPRIETVLEEGKLEVGMEFIRDLRAEANRQKAQNSSKDFAKMFGNDGKDMPNFKEEPLSELDKIADSFEIIEE